MATPPHDEITLDRTDVWEVISSVLQKWGNSLPDKKPCPLRRQRKRFTKEGCGPGPCRLPCCRPMLTVLREDVNSEQRREVIGQVRELLIRFELRTRGQARLALSCRDDMRNALLLLLHQLILSCQRGERLTYMAPGGYGRGAGQRRHTTAECAGYSGRYSTAGQPGPQGCCGRMYPRQCMEGPQGAPTNWGHDTGHHGHCGHFGERRRNCSAQDSTVGQGGHPGYCRQTGHDYMRGHFGHCGHSDITGHERPSGCCGHPVYHGHAGCCGHYGHAAHCGHGDVSQHMCGGHDSAPERHTDHGHWEQCAMERHCVQHGHRGLQEQGHSAACPGHCNNTRHAPDMPPSQTIGDTKQKAEA
ncbi:uncharacterized protein LOC122371498 [Amphibalanus amphitrite]|uniref:uncharacterized protein LOC122371498 n=1 Tax=Amphibalanus amphitrite TaxID=1232801 RepID=UPI001C92A861|nr:uncharacterized protein LOC122371498 [Amphibalanus amphitrite]